ncbi:MAG: hypothetical protein JNL25_15060 [Rhodospirillaceae bacterium]|nr:hypothetical protein [Rhodospirillaceae bacterium]
MSGGNRIFLCGLAAFLLLIGAGLATETTFGAERRSFVTGVAAANIAWDKPADIERTLQDIADAGFEHVRIGFKDPLGGMFLALDRAKAAGLRILITIPLIDGAVAAEGAAPRPRNPHFFPAHGLTQIDLDRYAARLEKLLDRIIQYHLPVTALEIGNEFNWSGYNGDLPLRDGGAVVLDEAAWHGADRAAFEAGLDRYAAVIALTRTRLESDPRLADIGIVSAGLADINVAFIRRVGATYIAPALVYKAMAARGLFDAIDHVGVHLYEPLRNVREMTDRPGMIAEQLDGCGRAYFAGKTCWLTEFGAALPVADCAPEDAARIELMQPLLAYLAQPANAERIPAGFYYDWSADPGFSLVRCGRPTALTRQLLRGNIDQDKDFKGGLVE